MGERQDGKAGGLFVAAAVAMIAIAIIAFTPRYFAPLVNGTQEFRTALHVHGVTGLAWLVLFLTQAMLIRGRHYNAHKLLGLTSIVLAIILFLSGVLVSLELYWRTRADGFAPANPILLVNLSDMVFFASFYVLAIANRKTPALHRPLMLLAALSLMNAAIFRVISYVIGAGAAPVIGSHAVMILLYGLALTALKKKLGSLPRLVWLLSIAVVVMTAIRIPVGFSPIWTPAADWLFALPR